MRGPVRGSCVTTMDARDSHRTARAARPLHGLAAAGLLAALAACSGGSGGAADASSGAASTSAGSGSAEPSEPAPSEPAPSGSPLALTAGASVVGLPDGVTAPPVGAVAGASRTTDPSLIYVVTFGSSTCPMVADPEAVATGAADVGAVEITFPEPTAAACTADYVPATTVVALPDASSGDLQVVLGPAGDVTLPAGSTEPQWVVDQG